MIQKCDKYRDPVHGFIEVRPLENEIINSEPFQRLRNIKQLALTNFIYYGAEHTRFGHSIGVMHLVSRAFRSVISQNEGFFSKEKSDWYEQILRIIALTHDLGHAPFSHASETVLPQGMSHEDFTEKIIKETCIAEIINKIGKEYVDKYGESFNITADLICDIYNWRNPGENSEFAFLNTFMDSELDCDKMDYLLRDSLYCGVNYGKYDIDRLISCLTVYNQDGIPRLAIQHGGVQAFEGFVLARYFMFVQVYFHRTRRYFDIMLGDALKNILPNGYYPSIVEEYLLWDDCKVMELIKSNLTKNLSCDNILKRTVYPMIYESNVHSGKHDKERLKFFRIDIDRCVGKGNYIEDHSADKMPHKIPIRSEIENEKTILIVDNDTDKISTISDESYLIRNLTEKINIERIYVKREYKDKAIETIKALNKKLNED